MDIDYDRKEHGEVAITRYVLYKQPRGDNVEEAA